MDTRSTHEIDGYRVIFEFDEGWRCECVDYHESDCEHVWKAKALRSAELRSRKILEEER